MALMRSLSGAIVLSLLSLNAYAAPSLDDVFKVRMTGDGSCAKYRTKGGNGQLDRMFEDMQTILHEASTVIEGDFEKDWDDTARSLTSSFFGLKGEGDDGKETPAADSLDGKVLAKIKKWYQDADGELQNSREDKAEIFCDSTFMDYKVATDQLQNDDGTPAKKPDGSPETIGDYFGIYWFPELNRYLDFKEHKDAGPGVDPKTGKKTYCAAKDHFAWTIEPAEDAQYIILCPALFDRNVPDVLDTSAAEDGTVLDTREAKSLTWLHELFHLVFLPVKDSNGNWVERSPDALRKSARLKKDGTPYAAFPKQKQGFQEGDTNTIGAIQSMYLALWDKAAKINNNIDDYQSTKNPETYAWYAVAYYLSTKGDGKSEWSTGAARPHGSEPAGVTVPPKVKRTEEATTFVTVSSRSLPVVTAI